MKYFFIFFMFFTISFADENVVENKNMALCLDGFCLGSLEKDIIKEKSDLVSNVFLKKEKEVFSDVFHIKILKPKIKFNKILFFKQKYIFFINNGEVIAIAGFNKNYSILKDLFISSGVENIVFRLGNKNLKVINKKNNAIYLYSSMGYAFFDDKKDDVIDFFLLFNPVSK